MLIDLVFNALIISILISLCVKFCRFILQLKRFSIYLR